MPADENTRRLEALWSASGGQTQPMSPGSWQLVRVRPNNSPLRRMAAIAHLVTRYPGLLDGLLGLLPIGARRGAVASIEARLVVAATGYWAEHYDFGCPCHPPNPTLLGRGRAGEIVVNVMLPFAAALGRPENETLALFHAYHRLAANSIEQHMMGQLGIGRSEVNSARRQQGLVHIYSAFCTRGRCSTCVLS